MNTTDIVCLSLLFPLLFLRYVITDHIKLLYTAITLFLLGSAKLVLFYTYERSLVRKNIDTDVEYIVKHTFEDIDDITTLQFSGASNTSKSFEEDVDEKHTNNNILRNSLLASLIPLFVFFVLAYKYDNSFKENFTRSFISVAILFCVDVFFCYAIVEQYRGEGYEEIRHEIIDKFLNK